MFRCCLFEALPLEESKARSRQLYNHPQELGLDRKPKHLRSHNCFCSPAYDYIIKAVGSKIILNERINKYKNYEWLHQQSQLLGYKDRGELGDVFEWSKSLLELSSLSLNSFQMSSLMKWIIKSEFSYLHRFVAITRATNRTIITPKPISPSTNKIYSGK